VRAAQLVPDTFNDSDNTVDVVWTTGARVRRYDWYTDQPYEEELVVSSEAVDMTRFEAGAVSVLDGHRTYGGVSSILGRALSGSIENGQGRAKLQLSSRDELAGIVRDIKSGVIRNISFGYSVAKYEITRAIDRTDGVNLPLYRAVSWCPQEISFVTVPADPSAGTRSQAPQGAPCEFIRANAPTPKEPTMPTEAELQAQRDQEAASAAAAAAAATAAAATRAAADTALLARAADITALCQRMNLPKLAEGYIREGKTVEQAGLALLDELAKRDAQTGGHLNVRGISTVTDEVQTRMDGITEALLNRVDPKAKLTDNGRQYRGMDLIGIGREFLESRGVSTRGLDKMTIATRMLHHRDAAGFHGTSDFTGILANVANKRLRQGYDENPGTYMRWARQAPDLPDFKSITVAQLGAMPDLLAVNEAGEIKYGSFRDGAETYNLTTYGRIVSLTRQAIVNDDLRAFDRIVAGFGAAAARLENRTVYAQLTANGLLSDGVALFAAGRNNLATGAPSVLQFSSLTTMRTAMRGQKGLNNEELNLIPATLIVPAALEQLSYQLTSSQYVPAQQSNVNEFRTGGRTALDVVVEPILDANSLTAWYAAAMNSQIDTVEYAYLAGAAGPVMDSEVGFEIDGVSFKCRLDFAAKALDGRGLYKSNGA
jgi:phage major head subunit gpT-like protein